MEDYSNRLVQKRTWNELGKEINETGKRKIQQKSNISSSDTVIEEIYSSTQEATETEPSELLEENEENEQLVEDSSRNESLLVAEDSLTRNKGFTKKRKELDPLEKCAIDYFTSKKRCQSEKPQEKTENADLLFFKSLLPDLAQMTNVQKHEFKSKTIQTIGEILYKPLPINSQHFHFTSSNISTRPPSVFSHNSYPSSQITHLLHLQI
ncbi:hypothetical protein FQR65_LT04337 [Abscondita terminalis]|nr:hypothetical protein FQR65_LT04337 [Abscondita terminalis]